MRPNDANWQPGSACPSAEPTTSTPPLEVSLEQDDGWRLGAAYAPIMLLPTGSYASMAFEVLDARGTVLFPADTYAIGPDAGYPWMAPPEEIRNATLLRI